MTNLDRFYGYSAEFEKTYQDDQWERLRGFFHDDATYEVVSATLGCVLEGPEAIFAGIKKSLDGFDRRFDKRVLAVVGEPSLQGDSVSVDWTVTYRLADFSPYVLRGQSVATFRDNKIAALSDAILPAAETELAEWLQATGVDVNPAYV